MSKESAIERGTVPEDLSFRTWQAELRNGRLLGHECSDCGHRTSFPRGACDACGSRSLDVIQLPDSGEVYSETSVHVAPEGFENGYGLGLVDLDGAHVLCRIDGAVEIGDTVEFSDVFEGNGDPAPVFRQVD